MKNFKRYLVTSALPYANGPIHIGHLAGVYIPSDIYTRYLRMKGVDVISICGSDEHGVPITLKARKEGVTPQEIVDRYHSMNKKAFEDFGIAFDIYSRTSNKVHYDTASEFFRTLYDKGEFTEKTSEQYYDEEAGCFLADRYIMGTCPHCGNENAYGDQCEKCGTSLSPNELINPHSTISGSKPVLRETLHWYLPLDKYEPWLKKWILEDHKEWKANVYGQCKSWLDQGCSPERSAAISTGAFLYLLRVQKEKFSMFGSMLLSVIYLLQKNLLPTGKNTGRIRRQKWFISSEKIILFSIVLFSLRCLKPKEVISCLKMFRPMNF